MALCKAAGQELHLNICTRPCDQVLFLILLQTFQIFFCCQQVNSFRRVQLKYFYFICKFLYWTISAFKPKPSTWTHQPPFSKIFTHDSSSYDLFDAALIREDVAESLTPWYAVTHNRGSEGRRPRVPAETIKKIKEAIPARSISWRERGCLTNTKSLLIYTGWGCFRHSLGIALSLEEGFGMKSQGNRIRPDLMTLSHLRLLIPIWMKSLNSSEGQAYFHYFLWQIYYFHLTHIIYFCRIWKHQIISTFIK